MCPHEEKLTAWLLGDLAPGEQEAMTRHVDGCGACRAAAEELSRVLTPLRSGLAKDSRLRLEPRRDAAPRRTAWAWLWHSPHEGLKRAALLAVSFGTLFALLSTLYQGTQRDAVPAGQVTNIEFKKRSDDAAPPLRALPAPHAEEAAAEHLSKEVEPHALPLAVESKPVPYPTPPAAAPSMPALRRLPIKNPEPAPKESAAPAAAVLQPPPAAPAKAAAKRERAKAKDAPALTRPPADLQIKPALLAGTSLAATNAAGTNAAPTNAVAPKHTGKP